MYLNRRDLALIIAISIVTFIMLGRLTYGLFGNGGNVGYTESKSEYSKAIEECSKQALDSSKEAEYYKKKYFEQLKK